MAKIGLLKIAILFPLPIPLPLSLLALGTLLLTILNVDLHELAIIEVA